MDDNLLDDITYNLMRGKKYNKIMRATLKNIRRKYSVKQIEAELLLYFSRRPDAVASEIERTLDLNKGQVSTALLSLCKNGFLESSINPDDRRYTVYRVLDKGQQFIEEADTRWRDMRQRMVQGITLKEMNTFRTVVQKVYNNMTEMYGEF